MWDTESKNMPKKQWTPEDRKAFGEKMKAAKAARKAIPTVTTSTTNSGPVFVNYQPDPVQPSASNDDIGELLRRIQELEARQSSPQVGPRGMVGTFEKYRVDPSLYPSPIDRLSNEAQLQRFAFKENYEMTFATTTTSYQTQDGINVREPKFTLDLIRVLFDEETGQKTNGRYTVCRMVFHEDPEAAIVVANEHGLPIDQINQKEFLDEMRYLRMRDWLIDAFYPPKSTAGTKKKEMVIGGKLVEFFEVNSEDASSIPFSQLKTKL